MFKGPGEGINIVPMDKTFNGSSGAWYQLESDWKKLWKIINQLK